MNNIHTYINFREVIRGDTFTITLAVDAAYEITEDTAVRMEVRPGSDYPQDPILVFDSEAEQPTITVDGQDVTLYKAAEGMLIPPGRYSYDCQFTTNNIVTTLFSGFFEVLRDQTE